jgi:Putative beta-barrel porin-2, OmpL-like. bbp2
LLLKQEDIMPAYTSVSTWLRFASIGFCLAAMGHAQQPSINESSSAATQNGAQPGQPLTPRERQLLERIEKLEQRIAALESKQGIVTNSAPAPSRSRLGTSAEPSRAREQAVAPRGSNDAVESPVQTSPPTNSGVPGILAGTTINGYLDTYYAYNFNSPIGRVNLLRAYDVSSNAISLNQADLVIENAPDLDKGKRWGVRLDFQYGQATETLQGNAANELRPDVYRAVFQAYGTYIFPVGTGLTVDFGKWASSIGFENNYTKDQMNYSRSFWFNFLPFYHMGARVNYKVNSVLGLNYWIVNGTQQTEPNNGYKDELFGLTLQPHKTLNWTVNYYLGQEHANVILNPPNAPPGLPTLQGTPFEPIANAPKGKLNIFDSYATWQPSNKLTFGLEGDYEIERLQTNSAPLHVDGGAVYTRYQLTPKIAFAGRAEYLSDRGGLFSGITQALKENTFTIQYKVADGFMMMGEWRRDFSNRPYFLTNTLGILKKDQNTATLGLIWWFGQKQGAW